MNNLAVAVKVGERYQNALFEYLAAPEEVTLLSGYDLGRSALREGLGVLDVVTMHSSAVATALSHEPDGNERERFLNTHTAFFIEALSPFEMGHRAFRDANTVLRRMNDMLEGQAKRIANALHSEAGQLLASLHIELAEATRDLPPEKTTHLTKIRQTLLEIEHRLRNLSHELRPPVLDDLGLSAALALMAQGVSSRWGLPVIVSVDLKGDLPAVIENTVYRSAQEALTNAAKHAGANRAEIRVRQLEHKIVCSIRDDGNGFDDTDGLRKQRPGLGLTEIKERVAALGGAVRLGHNGDRGTDLKIEIPLDI
jgi:signal transduction histidine kinase